MDKEDSKSERNKGLSSSDKNSKDYVMYVESMGTKRSIVLRRNPTEKKVKGLAIETMENFNVIIALITIEEKMRTRDFQGSIMNEVTQKASTKRNVSTVEK